MRHIQKLLILILFLSCLLSFSQTIRDTLKNKSYKELYKGFYQSNNKNFQHIYTDAFIAKSKNEGNTEYLMEGYYMKVNIHKEEKILLYADSIIYLSRTLGNKYFPALAYYAKAKFYYDKRKFQNAMDNGIESLHYSNQYENKNNIARCNLLIGLLKSRMGEQKKAISILKDNNIYIEKNDLKKNLLHNLFAISTAYQENRQLDSASIYNNLGYKKSVNTPLFQNYFRLNQGIVWFYRNDYPIASDSIEKCIPILLANDDKPNLAISYFYKAKIYKNQNKYEKMVSVLKKIDTIFLTNFDLHPKIRESYTMLIEHYKKNNNLKEQVTYINRIIKLDSILHANEVYVGKELIEKYDIPKLISEKEGIISSIKKSEENKARYLLLFIILGSTAVIISFYQFYKKKTYKRRFIELLESNQKEKNNKSQKVSNESLDKKNPPDIPEDVINYILEELEIFEEQKLFTSTDMTSSYLANQIGTNVKYLSKVVNFYKKKSFTHYINDLRVNYALERLKNEESFRKYTLVAIANEVGFKKAESFSKAFKKEMNLTPAFFIKELNSKEIISPNS